MFNDKFLKWLATLATIVMLFVQLGGALVTKTGSEDGCGSSWPLCHGSVIPSDWPIETIIELAHRGVSGLALILVVLLAYISWVKLGHIKEVRPLCITSIAFILLQALIGAAAVIWQQNDFILSLHFGISLISFASVLLLTLIIYEVDKKFEATTLVIDNHLKRHTYAVTFFIYFVIYSGALVRHANASLSCLSWPLCHKGSTGLPQTFYEWVQMSHRALAFFIFIWILYIFIYAFRNYAQYRVIKYGWTLAFILICLQVTTGALSIFTRVNIFIALLHALFITMLFGLLCYFIMLIIRSKRRNQQ